MIPSSVRIFVCTVPQDMRRSFDGLALAIEENLGEDPRSGAVFCFINKRDPRWTPKPSGIPGAVHATVWRGFGWTV